MSQKEFQRVKVIENAAGGRLEPLLPVSWLAADVSDRNDLDAAAEKFPVDHKTRKLLEKKSAGRVGANCPSTRGLSNLGQGAIHFVVEFQSRFWTPLQIPVKCRVVLSRTASS